MFTDGHRETAAYAERLSARLSVETCSVVLGAFAAEIYPASWWGRLNDHAEIAAALDPLKAELASLDHALASQLRVRDVVWSHGRGTLRTGDVAVEIDEGTVTRVASDVAEIAGIVARAGLKQAA